MATTTPSAALVPVAPVFTNTERLTLAGFLAGYSGLVPGSDAGVSPAKTHDVLRFATNDLAAAGMSTAEVLWAMTPRAAQACGLGHRKGRIAVGFDADLLAIDGDPLEDLAAIRRLRAVYTDGLPVSPAPDVPASVAVH